MRVQAVGWAPTDPIASPGDTRSRAHQRITATLMRVRNIAADGRCALCVRGAAEIEGAAAIDARAVAGDPACGVASRRARPGMFSAGPVSMTGGVVYGSNQPASGPNHSNRVSSSPADIGGPYDILAPGGSDDPALREAFDGFALAPDELDGLRRLARSNGTYYRGSVSFDSAHRLPSGIVFVDTADGQDASSATPDAAATRVTVAGSAASGPGNVFDGWLIVNGSLAISGPIQMNGLVYAIGDIQHAPSGPGRLEGQMIAAHVGSGPATRIAGSGPAGHAVIRMNCAYVKNGGGGAGFVPQTWSILPGSYSEQGSP